MRAPEREAAYTAIDGERDYQTVRWGVEPRKLDEFILYLVRYANLAMDTTTKGDEAEALHVVRKIGALAVACMEEHGAPQRKP